MTADRSLPATATLRLAGETAFSRSPRVGPFKCAGDTVYSVEVENVLMGWPGMVEAAVVGKPCPVLGERVHAFVHAPGAVHDDAALRAFCAERLADYKVPETLTWTDAPLPRNANGKLMKRLLRERLPA